MTDQTLSDPRPNFKDPDEWSKTARIPAPQKMRRGEVREGGFIIISRTPKKRLLRAAAWPVECGSLADAVIASKRLREKFPEMEFCIFEQVGSFGPDGMKGGPKRG